MAVTPDYIESVSPYVFGATKNPYTKTFTQTMFDVANQNAQARFAREDPGFQGAEQDQAVGYLVCHFLHLAFEGDSDDSGYKAGDFSVTRHVDGESGEVVTRFFKLYRNMVTLKDSRMAVAISGVKAADSQTAKAMHPSNQRIPQLDYDDNTLGQPTVNENAPPGTGPQPRFP
jgi:hypothetical protein